MNIRSGFREITEMGGWGDGEMGRLKPTRRLLPAGLALIFLALAPAALLAQSDVQTLTLDQALAIAMDQNRDVQKAEEYRNWVKGKYIEERAGALPTFSLNGADRRDVDKASIFAELFPTTTDTQSAEVTLTQTLFTWGQVGAAIKAAKVGIASAEEQLRLYQQAARRDVTAAFYDVLLAKELADIADKNLAQKEAHLDEAQKKFTLGTATDYDVLSAKVDVENARPATIRARNLVQVSKDQLRFLLGQDTGNVDALGTLDATLAQPPTYEDAVATAFKRRPDLAAQADRVEVYRQLVKIANAGDKPRLDLMGYYGQKWTDAGWANMNGVPTRLNPSGNYWSLGVFLKFPFFDGMKTKGQVMQARSDQTTAQIELAKLTDQVSLQARTAVDAVRENAEIVRGLSGTVEQAEKVLFMANKGFEYGVKTKLDVDDAQQGLNQARGNLARARRDYLVAQVSLLYVEGILGEEAPPAQPPAETGKAKPS
jgi:outer membrane protein TolC